MNEQELFLKQKIEKREKFDTILAYVLIVILLGAILFILYLKFMREEEVKEPTEYVPNYISLSDISNSFNSSSLVSGYMNDNVTLSSSVLDNSLIVNYVKDDSNISFNFNTVGNELVVNYGEDNNVIGTDIYKEVASIICVYYGNAESDCRSVLSNVNEDSSVDGIRLVKVENTTSVYIDYTKGLFVNNSSGIYTTVTSVGLDEVNYVVNMFDTEVNNINVVSDDTGIKVSGSVNRLTDNRSNITILVKLYDANGTEITSGSQIFDENNFMGESGTFEVSFVSSESLDLTNVSKYSIEIIK